MTSEYDPVLAPRHGPPDEDLARVREAFAAAGRPYLSSPWPWLLWSLLLPAAALATPAVAARFAASGVLFLWSGAILVGGAVEAGVFLRRGERGASGLGSWVLRVQGNLSLLAVVLSLALLWHGLPGLLPGLWLLLLGHSLYSAGSLAFAPLGTSGLLYQAGGVAALVPGTEPLLCFALATWAGNLQVAVRLFRADRSPSR